MPQIKFSTDAVVKMLARDVPEKPKELRYFERQGHNKGSPNLMLNVSYSGALTWHVLFYDGGKPRTKRIEGGSYPEMSIKLAREAVKKFDTDRANASATAGAFKQIAEDWVRRHVDKRGLHSKPEIERHLKVYVYPKWANKKIFDITRDNVNTLLDHIEDDNGPRQADAVLATIRGVMTWYAVRNGKYNSPLVKGMNRAVREDQNRTLSDDEIRVVWKCCDEMTIFGAIIRLALLTGQRRGEIAPMRWDDIKDGVWTIPRQKGEKENIASVKLPKMALAIIDAMREFQIAGNPHVFPGAARGQRPRKLSDKERKQPPHFNSWSECKAKLDKKVHKLLPDIEHWVIHDLRRTARSLMPRAGIDENIAERTIGHKLQGMMKIYNKHPYFEQKTDALQRLANLVASILNPPDKTNVVRLRKR